MTPTSATRVSLGFLVLLGFPVIRRGICPTVTVDGSAVDPQRTGDGAVELEGLIDVEAWKEALAKETANRAMLSEASRNWAEVEDYLRRGNAV